MKFASRPVNLWHVLAIAVLLPQSLWGQTADTVDLGPIHTVTAGLSTGAVIDSDAPRGSSAGGDYMYRLNPKWEIGVQLDTDWSTSYGDYEGFAIVPVVAYTVTSRINLFMGAGFEHSDESGDNTALGRFGGEYTFYLSDDQRTILVPGGFLDYGDGEWTISFQLSIGYMW